MNGSNSARSDSVPWWQAALMICQTATDQRQPALHLI